MKVIYVENSVQDENTKNPQLIDDNLYYWKTQLRKVRGTFKEEILTLSEMPYTKYLLIQDFIPTDKGFCDQGCKPGEGCKKNYIEDNHGLFISCYIIKQNQKTEESFVFKSELIKQRFEQNNNL